MFLMSAAASLFLLSVLIRKNKVCQICGTIASSFSSFCVCLYSRVWYKSFFFQATFPLLYLRQNCLCSVPLFFFVYPCDLKRLGKYDTQSVSTKAAFALVIWTKGLIVHVFYFGCLPCNQDLFKTAHALSQCFSLHQVCQIAIYKH
jgi:hypothetical protein